jgi:GT2 family glycosyltransferase
MCQDCAVAELDPYAVVIVTYNHSDSLPACLAAVAGLEPAPRRVIVVDNASRDGSADVVEACDIIDQLELIREGDNTGFAAGANRAIRATDTPWVLVLNPDCAPRTDMVGCLLESVTSRPEAHRIGVVAPKLLRADGPTLDPTEIIDTAGMVVTPSGRHFDRAAGQPDDHSLDDPAWVFGASAAAALYRRQALDDVAYPNGELFAESFFAYREDAELAWRLQSRGWSCLFEPVAVGSHRRGFRPDEGRRGHEAVNRYSVRNRFLLRWHCADNGWHLRCLPWWLLRDLMVVGACLTVERSSLPGLTEAWQLRPDAFRRRRWVLGRRTVSSRQISGWFRRRGRVEEVTRR